MINLGDKVRDRVTGFTGIVTSRTVFLNGCVQYGIKSDKLVNGKPVDAEWVDEAQIQMIKKGAVLAEMERSTGGPQEHPKT